MKALKKPKLAKWARRRVRMRSALLLTLCVCLLMTLGRIALLAAPALVRPLYEMLLSVAVFGGGAFLGLRVLDGDRRDAMPALCVHWVQIMALSLLGVLCVFPATLTADVWRSLLSPAVIEPGAGMAVGADAALFIVQLLRSALIAPVCEELFFRGYLLGAVQRFGRVRAVAVTALCFALTHGVNGSSLLVYALLGLLLGAVMLRTQSVLAPMVVHGCYNLTIMLISYTGLSPLFERLTLISCIVRLLGCLAFWRALLRVWAFAEAADKMGTGEPWRPALKECARLLLAALCAALAAGLSLLPTPETGVVWQGVLGAALLAFVVGVMR